MSRSSRHYPASDRRVSVFFVLAFFLAAGILFVSAGRFRLSSDCGCPSAGRSATGGYEAGEKQAYWQNQPVDYPRLLLAPEPGGFVAYRPVLGENNQEKWIEVDLSDQKLFARRGTTVDYEFLISSGKPWTPTVKGEFRIWLKLRYAKMSGGSKEDGSYYYLPNVPYIQYFYRDYGLHGAYWHNNFGQTMSHGCVNLSVLDAEKLFYWTSPALPSGKNIAKPTAVEPGTRIVIHD